MELRRFRPASDEAHQGDYKNTDRHREYRMKNRIKSAKEKQYVKLKETFSAHDLSLVWKGYVNS